MIRVVFEIAVLFLLPTLVYLAWVALARDRGKDESIWDGAPILWLVIAGTILALGTMVVFGNMNVVRQQPGEVYVPPDYKDGKIIPGHFESAPKVEPSAAPTPVTAAPAPAQPK